MPISHIKLNGVSAPMGYDPGPLLLSWQTEGMPGTKPAETRLRVWDSAEHLVYETRGDLNWEGTPLSFSPLPLTRYTVEIQVTDDRGFHTRESTVFETGFLSAPWKAQWIGPNGDTPYAPILSRAFPAGEGVTCARLYITGLGLYCATLNGRPVSAEVLAPGVWDYEEEVQYQTYDVTHLIGADNRLEVTLGNGWYKGRFGLEQARPFGDGYALLAELHLRYADGSTEVIPTGEAGWTWRESDIAANGIYDGEVLDRTAHTGRENPERPVASVPISLRVADRISPPVTEAFSLPVREVLTTPAGETVLDFGQNHTGWLRFRAALPAGCEVRFDFGEVLQQGNFYNDNYRSAVGGFTYRSDGREETVCQLFTFYGFRYVRVSGWPGPVSGGDFDSPVLHTELERTGFLTTGHESLNRLYENVLWSQRSNFLSIPTDCPQRDERLGWTGDAQIFAPTACYNMDCRAFYRSYLRFLRLEQRRHGGAVPTYVPSMGDFTACALWSDAAAILPLVLLRFSAVTEEAAEHYELMKDWVDFVTRSNPGPLYTEGFQFGDWLAQDGITDQSFKGGTDDVFLASVYRMNSARILSDLARRTGRDGDAKCYAALADSIRAAILDTYFTPAGRLSVDTQAAYVTALRFGLWRDKEVLLEQFRRRLRFDGFRIRCGFAGAPLLCSVLAEHGMEDLALDVLLHRGFPGWMYGVELGATTIWERWNSLLEDGTCSGTGMNSFNHYAYGSVMEYVYGHLAGLRPGEQGFRHAVIAPKPDVRLGRLECVCRTPSGEYAVSWRIGRDGVFRITVTVPFGCTATLTLPRSGEEPLLLEAATHYREYIPTEDFRRVYTLDTRLSALAEDEAAQAILGEELPQLLGLLRGDNREFTTQTFRELGHAFFLGLTPEKAAHTVARLSELLTLPCE